MTPEFCRAMPKVELHVHLEGSIKPKTLLELARRNNASLPADTEEGLREWYRFRDFPHFIDVYVAITKCIKTPDDIELVMRTFLEGQAGEHILHTEVTYSGSTVERFLGIPWDAQHKALLKALDYGKKELGVTCGVIVDIVRGDTPERALEVATWAANSEGVCALGIAGEEKRGTVQYRSAFEYARKKGLPVVAHAGETCGPESIREVLEVAQPVRIGHGVRCVEDGRLVKELADRQIPLEVCPTSNVALGVYPSFEEHPLPNLLDEGLYVTLNSDDPPLFGTSLSDEFARSAEAFGFDEDIAWTLSLNAARASLLPDAEKRALVDRLRDGFS